MKTRITELLGIKHPILLAGMSYVSNAPLAAAVSNAGGLGVISPVEMTPEETQRCLQETKRLTSLPFGIVLSGYMPGFRRLLEIAVEEKVAVISTMLGSPKEVAEKARPQGIKVIPQVGSVAHAIRAERDGADAVIVIGMEGGGHSGTAATTVLLPKVADSVKIPVVAAGGFCDGRGLVAALALGAEGICMGTRFALTQESPVCTAIRQKYLEATEEDTLVEVQISGFPCRLLKNKIAELAVSTRPNPSLWEILVSGIKMSRRLKAPPGELIRSALEMRRIYKSPLTRIWTSVARVRQGLVEGDADMGLLPCGQVCGRIDRILSCQEVIDDIIAEAEKTYHTLHRIAL